MKATGVEMSYETMVKICDLAPAVIALYNIQTGRYLYVNHSLKRLLGYKPAEFIDGGLEFVVGLVHPDDVTDLMAKNQAALDLANRRPTHLEPVVNFEYRMRHKDGDWVWLRTEGTVFGRTDDGQVELILNTSQDISARKQAQLEVAKSVRMLEKMLNPYEEL